MATFRLVLEYDGTDFHGWQRQPSVRTVEGVLGDVLRRVTGEAPPLTAAGRTDAGAHSHGQVVGLSLERPWEPTALRAALNSALPEDVVVCETALATPGFHARFDAVNRTYRYVVAQRRERSPLLRRFAWQVGGDLDLVAMRRASALLRGTHDFGAFGRSPRPGGGTVRTIDRLTLRRVHPLGREHTGVLVIEVSADAFLYGMMRGIAGALVAVGRGRLGGAAIADMLAAPGRRHGHVVAPARGLHQWSVVYGGSAAAVERET